MLFCLLICGVWFWLSSSSESFLHRGAMLEKEGVTLDCDMYAKLRELFDDPAMTDAKWREWLPVFEFADAEEPEVTAAE